MIAQLLHEQRAYLATIAEHWLQSGATAFSVWSNGAMLACWPTDATEAYTLAAPVRLGAYVHGELHLAGPNDVTTYRQLIREAQTLERILQLEDDLAQMTEALIETQDQLLALYELTQATRDQRDITEILQSFAAAAARLLKADEAALFLDSMFIWHATDQIDDSLLLPYARQVQHNGQEIVLNRIPGELSDRLKNICILPIRVRQHIGAALGIFNRDLGFMAPDVKLARVIAEQAGIQLEHALFYQESIAQARLHAELDIARNVQRQMLPQQQPTIASLNVYAKSCPALQVGGDFYDFVTETNRQPLFILGDVAGKGISAALIMGMIHAITHSAARFMPTPSPASILFRANEHLYDDLTALEAFATIFVAQYDTAAGLLRYANAGHAPIIYRPFGGVARLLEPDGVPVGVLPDSMYENQTIPFEMGSLLVALTDGFNETQNSLGEMFGYEQLFELIDTIADQPAQMIAEILFDAVNSFADGSPQHDDQTLLVIKGVAV